MFSVWCLSSTLNTLSFFFPCLGWRNLKAQVFNSRNLGTCAPDVSDQDQKCAESISSSLSNYYLLQGLLSPRSPSSSRRLPGYSQDTSCSRNFLTVNKFVFSFKLRINTTYKFLKKICMNKEQQTKLAMILCTARAL